MKLGLKVKKNDVNELAEALTKVASGQLVNAEQSRASQAYAKQNFSYGKIVAPIHDRITKIKNS
jgi:hypothetical protein